MLLALTHVHTHTHTNWHTQAVKLARTLGTTCICLQALFFLSLGLASFLSSLFLFIFLSLFHSLIFDTQVSMLLRASCNFVICSCVYLSLIHQLYEYQLIETYFTSHSMSFLSNFSNPQKHAHTLFWNGRTSFLRTLLPNLCLLICTSQIKLFSVLWACKCLNSSFSFPLYFFFFLFLLSLFSSLSFFFLRTHTRTDIQRF